MSGETKRAIGRPTKYKPEFCEVVIECGADGQTLAEMADAIDIDRATLNEWMDIHPEFSRAVKRGIERAQAWWERQGRIATFGGCDGFQGTTYIFNMTNRFPDDWRDRHQTELSGPNGGPIKTEDSGAAKLAAFLDSVEERSGTAGEPAPE